MCDIQRGVCVCVKLWCPAKEWNCDQMRFGVDQSSTRLLWDLSVLVSSEERVHTTLVVGWLNKMQDWEILCMLFEITASETVYMLFNLCQCCTVYKLVEHVVFGKARFCNSESRFSKTITQFQVGWQNNFTVWRKNILPHKTGCYRLKASESVKYSMKTL